MSFKTGMFMLGAVVGFMIPLWIIAGALIIIASPVK